MLSLPALWAPTQLTSPFPACLTPYSKSHLCCSLLCFTQWTYPLHILSPSSAFPVQLLKSKPRSRPWTSSLPGKGVQAGSGDSSEKRNQWEVDNSINCHLSPGGTTGREPELSAQPIMSWWLSTPELVVQTWQQQAKWTLGWQLMLKVIHNLTFENLKKSGQRQGRKTKELTVGKHFSKSVLYQ